MNDDLHGFLKDLFILIQEMYDDSLREASNTESEADAAYRKGATFAYYSVLDLIRSQVTAFGYDEKQLEFVAPILGELTKNSFKNRD